MLTNECLLWTCLRRRADELHEVFRVAAPNCCEQVEAREGESVCAPICDVCKEFSKMDRVSSESTGSRAVILLTALVLSIVFIGVR